MMSCSFECIAPSITLAYSLGKFLMFSLASLDNISNNISLWVCSSVLLPPLRNCHLNRKATELVATLDVLQEVVSELQEEIQAWYQGKGRLGVVMLHPVWQCHCSCVCMGRQGAHRQLLTATHRCLCNRACFKGHEGMEWEDWWANTWGETMFQCYFGHWVNCWVLLCQLHSNSVTE